MATRRRRRRAVHFFGSGGTYPGAPLNALTSAPSAAFQTLTSPLYDPDATRVPSGLRATANTWSVWPLRVLPAAPVSEFHSLTVMSAPQVAISGSLGCSTSFSPALPWLP